MSAQHLVQRRAGKWVLVATIVASGTSFMMGTVVSIALPTIQESFSTALAGLQWIVNAYVLTLASFLLLGGSLGDHFGRKKIFLLGIAVFGLGALLSGFATSLLLLIVFQALQGLGAALMVPGSLALINVHFAEQDRGKAIGLWSGISAGVAALGPFLGGWLVETFGWPAVFFFAVPLTVVAFVVTWMKVEESRNAESGRLDWVGAIVILLALFGLSFGLIQGPAWGWSHIVVLSALLAGLVFLALFFVIERKTTSPLVPLHIFRNRLVSGANAATFALYFALNGVIFFLVLNLQQIQEFSPTIAGLGMLPTILLITFLSGPGGALADKIGPRRPMIIGPLIVAFGMAWIVLAGRDANYWTEFLPGLVFFGAGMALVIAPLTKSALAVRGELSGAASGVNNAVARIAGMLAVAILGAVMSTMFQSEFHERVVQASLQAETREALLPQADRLGGVAIPESASSQDQHEARYIVQSSFLLGFRWVIGICVFLALLSAILSWWLIRPKASDQQSTS